MDTGRARLNEFLLAPDRLYLNHGSYGALPVTVAREQDRLRSVIERDATGFFQDAYPVAIRTAAHDVAKAFGGAGSDWVFVENATSAVNGILAGITLESGDDILTTSHGYGAVIRAMHLWAQRRGATLRIVELPSILESDDQVIEHISAAFGARTKLLVVDHITSATACIFPVREIAARARAAGIPVLIDGAHAPGQIALDVPSLGADWYTGNAHKWFFAPKGCGLLWTAPARQSETRPAVLSHGAKTGYTAAFDWIGTRDVTPWLCFAAAARAHAGFGGAALMARNRALALQAGNNLARALGGTPSAPPEMRGAMAAIALEMPSGPGLAVSLTSDLATALRRELASAHGISVPVSVFADRLWLRISAQIYNEAADYAALAAAWPQALLRAAKP